MYPRASPGGWQLIGTTDAVLWDLEADPPALLQPGRWVRFVDDRPNGPPMTGLEIVRPGPLSLIEDLGRPGLASSGVGRSGAADRASFLLANRLLGNPAGAAAHRVHPRRSHRSCAGRPRAGGHRGPGAGEGGPLAGRARRPVPTADRAGTAARRPQDRPAQLSRGAGWPRRAARCSAPGAPTPCPASDRQPLRAGDVLPVGRPDGARSKQPAASPSPAMRRSRTGIR